MTVEVPQVLQLQGGTPQITSGQTFAENLKITRNMQGGALSPAVLTSVLGAGGIGSLMAGSPIGALATAAQGAISSMQAAITAAIGGTGTPASVTALGDLSSAIGALSSAADSLVGISAGTYGPLDVLLHSNTVGMAGTPTPANLATSTVIAPTTSGPLVTSTQANAQAIANAIVAGTTTDSAGATQIAALTTAVSVVTSASSNAISGLRSQITALATAQAFGGAMAAGTHPEASSEAQGLNTWLQIVMDPATYAQMLATARNEFYVAPPTITTLAPLMNTYNVAYKFLPAAPATSAVVEVV